MKETTKELLDDAKETIKSIGATSRERLKNPLLGPFIIALFVYNWSSFAILFFSDKTIDCKIAIIDRNYSGLDGLFWPIGIAFIYYLAIPIIIAGCETILLPIEKIRIWIRYSRLGKEAEEEKKFQAVRSGNKEIEALNNEIKNLKAEMNLMIDSHDTTINRYIKQIEELNTSNKKINKTLVNFAKPTSLNYEKFDPLLRNQTDDLIISVIGVSQNFKTNSMPTKVHTFLKKNKLVTTKSNGFVITDEGKEFFNYLNENYAIVDTGL